jgi:hypothetical protein
MKMVEFTRDMRPHVKGETRLIAADSLADHLIETGAAIERPLPPGFGPRPEITRAPPATLPAPAKRYQTRSSKEKRS